MINKKIFIFFLMCLLQISIGQLLFRGSVVDLRDWRILANAAHCCDSQLLWPITCVTLNCFDTQNQCHQCLFDVRELDFDGVSLLPTAIGLLTTLEQLSVWLDDDDEESASARRLPLQIGRLTQLRDLSVYGACLPAARTLHPLRALTSLRLEPSASVCGNAPLRVRDIIDFSAPPLNLESLELFEAAWLGDVPSELGLLRALSHLQLSREDVDALPSSLGALENLESLTISRVAGTVAEQVFGIANLRRIDLGVRGDVALPSAIGLLTQLEWLTLRSTRIVTLPSELNLLASTLSLTIRCAGLGRLPFDALEAFRPEDVDLDYVDQNGSVSLDDEPVQQVPLLLTPEIVTYEKAHLPLFFDCYGTIPTQVGLLHESFSLFLRFSDWGERVSGTLPSELASITSLHSLSYFGADCQLGGAIPSQLFALTGLERISFRSCNFDALPALDWQALPVRNAAEKLSLWLPDNALSGTLPPLPATFFGSVELARNRLSGTISSAICPFANDYPPSLDLSDNLLSGVLPRCQFAFRDFDVSGNVALSGALSVNVSEILSVSRTSVTSLAVIGGRAEVIRAVDTPLLRAVAFPDGLASSTRALELSTDTTLTGLPPIAEIVQLTDLKSLALVVEPDANFEISDVGVMQSLLNKIGVQGFTWPACTNSRCLLHLDGFRLSGFCWEELVANPADDFDDLYHLVLRNADLCGERLSLRKFPSLGRLDLSRNRLSGFARPIGVEQLDQLEHLDLSHNELTGTVPFQLSLLNALRTVDLRFNNLIGNVPPFGPNVESCALQNADNAASGERNCLATCNVLCCGANSTRCEVPGATPGTEMPVEACESACFVRDNSGQCVDTCVPTRCVGRAAGWIATTCVTFSADLPGCSGGFCRNPNNVVVCNDAAPRAAFGTCADVRCRRENACLPGIVLPSDARDICVGEGEQGDCERGQMCDANGACVQRPTTKESTARSTTTATAELLTTTTETTTLISTSAVATPQPTPASACNSSCEPIFCGRFVAGWQSGACLRFSVANVVEQDLCNSEARECRGARDLCATDGAEEIVHQCERIECVRADACQRGKRIGAVDIAALCDACPPPSATPSTTSEPAPTARTRAAFVFDRPRFVPKAVFNILMTLIALTAALVLVAAVVWCVQRKQVRVVGKGGVAIVSSNALNNNIGSTASDSATFVDGTELHTLNTLSNPISDDASDDPFDEQADAQPKKSKRTKKTKKKSRRHRHGSARRQQQSRN